MSRRCSSAACCSIDGGDIALAGGRGGGDCWSSRCCSGIAGSRSASTRPAAARGAGGRALDLALLGLIALATTAALSVVGALLVAALFVVPALTARLFAERMRTWQLGQRRSRRRRGNGRALALGQDRRAARGDDRGRRRRRLRSLPLRGRWPAPGRRSSLPPAWRRPLCSPPAAAAARTPRSGQLQVVATTTQIGDFVREVGGNAVAVDQILQPNTDPHEYEPRPSDVARGRRGEARLRQRRQPRQLDRPGRLRQRQRRQGRRSRRDRAGAAPRRVERGGGLEVRPALVARPAQRRVRGAGDRRRAGARRPTRKAAFDRNAGAYIAKLRSSTAKSLAAWTRSRFAAQAGHRPRRLRLLRRALRDRRGRRRHSIPDHPGAAVGKGPQRPRRPDRTRAGRRRSSPRAR